MKEIFSQAIQKMKRKDFLDDVIREKTAEASAISGEAAKLRKKNGSRTGNELDLKIYQLNARKSTIEKLIAKCKTEIKALKPIMALGGGKGQIGSVTPADNISLQIGAV